MKIALLSDVHGNLPALQAVLDDLNSFQPDLLAVAGDLTGGPYSNEVIQVLRERGAVLILGNSDLALLRCIRRQVPEEWLLRKQFGLLRWNARHLSDEHFEFLSTLPEQTVISLPGTDPIRLVHGSPRDPGESIYPQKDLAILDQSLALIAEPVLVCGHTHEPWVLCRNGKLAINPGAVAGPLNGEIGAQYACLVWQDQHWQVTLKRVPYDLAPLKEAFVQSGLLQEGGPVARGFLLSQETGKDVTLAFLTFAFQLAEQAGFKGCKTLPDEIWDLAGAEFPWNA
jgi:putative phosphoesterase